MEAASILMSHAFLYYIFENMVNIFKNGSIYYTGFQKPLKRPISLGNYRSTKIVGKEKKTSILLFSTLWFAYLLRKPEFIISRIYTGIWSNGDDTTTQLWSNIKIWNCSNDNATKCITTIIYPKSKSVRVLIFCHPYVNLIK